MKFGNGVYDSLFLFNVLPVIVVILFRAGNICMPHLFLYELAVHVAVQKDSAIGLSDFMGRFRWNFKFMA